MVLILCVGFLYFREVREFGEVFFNLGLSEIGAEGQKVQKLKLVTFFLL